MAERVVERFGGLGINTWTTMLAIAGAESGYNPSAVGDYWTTLTGENRVRGQQINCGGYCSFGVWQIFMAWHYDKIIAEGGPDARLYACAAASLLADLDNGTRVARRILNSQGLGAWTSYNTAAYLDWWEVATEALSTILYVLPDEPPPIDSGGWFSPYLFFAFSMIVGSFIWGKRKEGIEK